MLTVLDPYRQGQNQRTPRRTTKKPQHMHGAKLKNRRTADIAGLGAFPEAFEWVPDFFVSCLEGLPTLIALAFEVGRGFFAFFNLRSWSESSRSLASVSAFLRFLDFTPAPGSGRATRFFGGGGVGVWSSVLSA